MSKANDEFVYKHVAEDIEEIQIQLANRVASRANLGFSERSSDSCVLSITSMLIHALDNWILYSTDEQKSLLALYNKICNG